MRRKRLGEDMVLRCEDCRWFSGFGSGRGRVHVCLKGNQYARPGDLDCSMFHNRLWRVR